MCVKSLLTNGLIVASVGVVFTVFVAVFGWIGVPQIIANVAKKTTVLEEGDGLVWHLWQDPPFPIYTDFYVFNVTNAADVLDKGAKPQVDELGPYSFREHRYKYIDDQMSNDATVFYREQRNYTYDDGRLGLDDPVTVPNPVFMAVSYLLQKLPYVLIPALVPGRPPIFFTPDLVQLIDDTLTACGQGPFMTVTVGQLLFDGWSHKDYIDLYKTVYAKYSVVFNLLPIVLPKPDDLPDDFVFGLFTNRNDTDDGLFEVNRGKQDYRLFGSIESWREKNGNESSSYLHYWKGNNSYCNTIRGTDGTIFPYGFDVNDKQFIYQTDLLRTVYATYKNDETFKGLDARRLILPRSVLADQTEAPENECFCMGDDEGLCPRTGAIYLGAGYAGAPLIGSNPHFYNGVDDYVGGVDALHPDERLHATYVLIEKTTNVLLQAAKRVQLNVDMAATNLTATKTFEPRVFVPLLWYEERVTIDDDTLKQFNVLTTIDIVLWLSLSVGILLTVVGAVLVASHFGQSNSGRQKSTTI